MYFLFLCMKSYECFYFEPFALWDCGRKLAFLLNNVVRALICTVSHQSINVLFCVSLSHKSDSAPMKNHIKNWINLLLLCVCVCFMQVIQGSTDPKSQRRRTSRGCGFGPRTSTATTWPLRAPASKDWNLPVNPETNAKLLAATAPILWLTTFTHHTPSSCPPPHWPPIPPSLCPPGRKHRPLTPPTTPHPKKHVPYKARYQYLYTLCLPLLSRRRPSRCCDRLRWLYFLPAPFPPPFLFALQTFTVDRTELTSRH